ncbi:PQQ-dependent sugar dehydrogenase [Flavilitoribacter nigricans]|nr:PQQ-dependent sugar dehydrogenase [Flavilitoribacter nigricans]
MTTKTLLTGLFFGLLLIACQRQANYTADAEVIAKGQQLFEIQCTACHNFRSSGIGPSLAGVTTEASPEWLKSFIKNPAEMIDGGDERAKKLHEEYKTYMPSFGMLAEEDIDAILAFMNTHQDQPELQTAADLGPPLEDPIPDTVPMSDLVLQLRQVALAPPTAEKPPVARINKMIPLPDGSRQFISDLNGILYEMKGGELQPFLKIADHFEHFINQPGLATGLGSYAFHPEFAENGIFYTNHTEDPKTSAPANFTFHDSIPRKVRWVLTEWKINDPRAATFSGSNRELMRVDMVTQIHGMQEVTFNPLAQPGDEDYGLLYIGIGDGGSVESGYPFLVQNKGRIWGNILRIDPAGNNSANGNYGIPPTNPFVDEMEMGGLGEIYAMGYRNPHRMLWDKGGDGKMLASDIGHHQIEELNIIEKGRNYGWPEREGTFRFDKGGNLDHVYALPEDDASAGITYPVIQFDHDEAGAISSGFIYYGDQIPELKGTYFFGGIVNGRVFFTKASDLALGKQSPFREAGVRLENGELTTFRDLTGINRVDLRYGFDAEGEMYIYTKADGKIYKIVGIDSTPMM